MAVVLGNGLTAPGATTPHPPRVSRHACARAISNRRATPPARRVRRFAAALRVERVRERSGFSFRDRDGDGHADVGVRHAVWTASPRCEPLEDGWPDAAECTTLHEERLRFLYDAALDEWRTVDGASGVAPFAVEDPFATDEAGEHDRSDGE